MSHLNRSKLRGTGLSACVAILFVCLLAAATALANSNTDPTGAPSITGTPLEGRTLTADIAGIADADGIDFATLLYQWVSNDGMADSDIEEATSATYVVRAADVGNTLKVRVTFTDDGGTVETLTSAATTAVEADNTPPTLVGQEIVNGAVVLEFSEELKSKYSFPPSPFGSAISITVDGVSRSVRAWFVDRADRTVTLWLYLPVQSGEATVISYTPPAIHPIEDLAGNLAAAFSVAIPASATATVPAAPSGLEANAGATYVKLSWRTPDDGGKTITGYEYRQKEGTNAFGTWTAVPNSGPDTRSYTVRSLTSDTEYTFEVRAKNGAGDGAAASISATPSTTETVAPTLVGQRIEWRQLVLRFNEDLVSSSRPDPSAFAVTVDGLTRSVMSVSIGAETGTVRLSLSLPVLSGETTVISYTPPATAYLRDPAGNAVAAFSVTIPASGRGTAPGAPPNLAAKAGTAQVTLTWGRTYNGDKTITGFEYRQKEGTNAFGTWTAVPNSGPNTRSYTVGSLTSDTEYTFEVRAKNRAGDGEEASVSATPSATETVPPALVTAVKADDHLRFVFDEVLDGDSVPAASALAVTVEDVSTDVIKVAVEGAKRTVRLEIAAQLRWSRDSIAVSYTPPLTNPIKDLAGNAAAAFTTQADGSTSTAPDAPRDLEAESGDGEVTLTWREPYDGGERIIGYEYRQKEGSDAFGNWMSMPFRGTLKENYTVSGLTNSTQYTFEVRADNGADKGSAASASATPEPLAPLTDTVPRTPKITRLYVDDGKLTVTGEVNLGIAVPVDRLSSVMSSFKVQWKSGTQDYDSTRETVLTAKAASASGSHSTAFVPSYDITGLTNGVEYTVRIIATNSFGDSAPSAERTATPNAKPDQLRQYIENDVVEEHESSFPWLRDVWDYMERKNVALYVRSSGNSHIQTYCPNGGLSACYVSSMTVTTSVVDGDADAKKRTILHELAQVYTLANGVSSTPAPIAMGHLYFASVGGQGCSSTELYADILASLVLGGSTTGASYWNNCSGATDSAAALAVVRSAAAGQAPAWFATTYNDTDGDPDLEKVWADLIAMGTPNYLYIRATQKAIAYQLQNQFGGYCDSAKVARAIEWESEARAVTTNPWKDGGCVPGAPTSPTGTPGGSGKIVVSWEAPASDGGSRIRGYRVQWKSGNEDFGSARLRFVLFNSYENFRPAKVSETVTGLTDGTEYTFRVFAFNQNGDGAAAEVAATPSATDAAAPELLTATVTRKNLVLNYNEALDETSSPAESAYAVTVAGNARAVSNVSVAESAVTLVLSSKVAKDEAVTVSYTVPTNANDPRVQDAAGNDAAALSGQAVTNNTPPVSTDATLDSISYSSAFQPCENDRRIHCPRPHGGLGTYFSSISMDVDSATDTITFWPHPANDQATVAYNPQDADAKADGYQLSLSTGQNLATFTVTAEDGVTTRTYSVTVTRTGNLPRLWVADDGATEGHDGVLEFPVWLSPASTSEVTVNYATSDGTATEGDDYRATSGKLTFKAGNVLTYVRVPIIDDTVPDSGETLTLTLSDPSGATLADGYETATGTIWNSEATVLSVADALGSEGDGSLAFEVTLNQAAESEVTVDYATADGTATQGEDYTKTSGALTFAVGDTSKTVSVPVTADEAEEGDETLTLVLTNPSGAGIADAAAIGTIRNTSTVLGNSAPTGVPVISGTVKVGKELTASVDGIEDADGLTGVTFAYRWVSNDGTTDTDIAGADESTYTPVAADVGKTLKVRVTFTDEGKTEETLTSAATSAVLESVSPTVTIMSSATGAVTSEFTVTVTFSEPVSGFEASDLEVLNGSAQSMTGTEDKTQYVVTITPNTEASGPVSVVVKVPSGVATDAAGNSNAASQPFILAALAEVLLEDSVQPSVSVQCVNMEATLQRREERQQQGAKITPIYPGPQVSDSQSLWWELHFSEMVKRAVTSSGDYEKAIAITGQDGTDPSWFGFSGGFSVFAGEYERKLRWGVTPRESDVSGVVITAPAGGYQDVAGNRNTASSNSLYLAHNWKVSVADASVTEGSNDVTFIDFEVTLNARDDCKTVTVDWTTADGTAKAGEDYKADSGTLTFAPGETIKTVSVLILDDTEEDSGETFTLQLSNAVTTLPVGNGVISWVPNPGIPSIDDGEATGTIIEQQATSANEPPTGLPVITGSAQVGEELTASVDGIEDADGLDGVTFSYQWASNDGTTDSDIEDADESTYTPVAADVGKTLKVRVTFTDNGKTEETLTSAATAAVLEPISVRVADAEVQEGPGATLDFVIGLSRAAVKRIEVYYRAHDGTATAGADYTAVNTSVVFSPGDTEKTVSVSVLEDSEDEGSETVKFWLWGVRGLSAQQVTDPYAVGTILGDDVTPPEAPRYLSVAAPEGREGELIVSWEAPESDGGGVLSGYKVQWKSGSEDYDGSVSSTRQAVTDAVTLSHTITGLTNGVEHTVRVLATNAVGDGTPVEATGTPRDRVAVTLSVGDAAAQAGRFQVKAVFADAVSGLAADDFIATRIGGAVAAVTDLTETETGRAWTAWVSAAVAGRYVVRLASGAATAGARASAAVVLVVDVDAQGNATAVAGPTVKSVSVATPENVGLAIEVTLAFSEAVTVDTTGGTPTVGLTVGSNARSAAYASGSGSNALVFAYRVVADDGTVTAVSVTASSLATGGGTIRDGAGRAADLTHPGASVELAVEPEAPAGPMTGFTLVDAATATDVGSIADGGTHTLADPSNGSYGIRVETADGAQIGSVKLALAGAKAVTRTDNLAPWSLYGDANGAVHGQGLPAGLYALTATAHAQADGSGAVLQTLAVSFTVAAAATEETPASDALTAAFQDVPAEHGGPGSEPFTFRVLFSEEIPTSYRVLRDQGAFTVVGGTVKKARRVDGRDDLREIHIQPSGWDAVTVTLPATTSCAATGAICMGDERMLSNTETATVEGPVAIDVADAKATEGPGVTLDFVVSLSRAASATVTVDYATADGTATEGDDYTRTSGTLTFEAGQTEKTVAVPVLDDAHDDDGETMKLVLSNASGARIRDREAVGTIENSDPLQRMWLSRFGRAVAGHVVEAVSGRLWGPLSGAEVTLGGQRVDLTNNEGGAALKQAITGLARALGAPEVRGTGDGEGLGPWMAGTGAGTWESLEPPALGGGAGSRTMTGRELLLGSSFHLTSGGRERGGPGLAAWGRVTAGGFDGEEDRMRLDGEVLTGTLGADAEWERWLAGVAVSVSDGEGKYNQPGVDEGTVESRLTSVSPYARMRLNERVTAWGLAGYGTGEMTIRPEGKDGIETDIKMRLGAVGARGALLEAGGFDLALRADAFLVQMESEKAENTVATKADASRLRLVLEGSRTFEAGEGGTLTPTLELGLRHDGGDAETGTGLEVGGRVAYAGSGLAVEAGARALVAHKASGYEEWGASGSVRLAPEASGRGLSFTLTPAWGAASSGVEHLWSLRDAGALAADGEFEARRRLDAEVGYGLGAFEGRGLVTPYAGLVWSDGGDRTWRAGARWSLGQSLSMSLEGTRREPGSEDARGERGVRFGLGLRW